jgi:hypothetical protein
MKRFTRITAALLITLLALLAISFGSCTHKEWICANCGSHKTAVGFSFATYSFMPISQVKASALDKWIVKENGSHTHEWKYTEYMDTYLFGGKAFTCWKAPPISFVSIDILNDFVDSASPTQIREFVEVMHHGTEKQQKETIDHLVEILIGVRANEE